MDNQERTLLYSENGDLCHGDNYTRGEAIAKLKQKGYKLAFSGRKFGGGGIYVIVGINNNNPVPIEQRRQNGLWNARKISI